MAENDSQDFGEKFIEVTSWWAEGVGKGIAISAIPILLISLGLGFMVIMVRTPLEIVGGLK